MIITLEKCLVPQCEGVDHRWEFERPTLREIKHIQTVTGQDIESWSEGLNGVFAGPNAQMIDAVLALVDILHRRNGLKVPFEEIDVDLGAFELELEPGEIDEDEQPEPEDGEGKAADPDPTSPSLPPEEPPPAPVVPASGPAPEVASPPISWPMPTTSGDGSASPPSPAGT